MTAAVRVGWIVDAQVDFMDRDGRLYVKDLGDDHDPGSELILPALERAVSWINAECDVQVFTGDWHGMEDEEIDAVSPDPAAGTYPPHCMGRSLDPDERAGAAIIPAIRPDDPVVLAIDAPPEQARAAAREVASTGRPAFIQKTRFDVFVGNPATEVFLKALEVEFGRPLEFIVVGVARDVCVTQAIDGMQARDYDVTALSDVTWGLGLEDEEATIARWSIKGSVTTLDALIETGET